MSDEKPLPKQPPKHDRASAAPEPIPLLHVLDELNVPALLIDGEAQVLATTTKFEALEGFSLPVAGERPRHWNRGADQRIKTYLRSIVAGEATGTPAPVPLVVDGRRRRPLVIKAIPLTQRPYRYAPAAHAVVIVMDLETSPAPSPDLLRHIFEFTPAEARLASRLAAGHGVADAARSIGISVGTARQHLKAVFAKTSCRRQSQLMSLLSRLTNLQQEEAGPAHSQSQSAADPPET